VTGGKGGSLLLLASAGAAAVAVRSTGGTASVGARVASMGVGAGPAMRAGRPNAHECGAARDTEEAARPILSGVPHGSSCGV